MLKKFFFIFLENPKFDIKVEINRNWIEWGNGRRNIVSSYSNLKISESPNFMIEFFTLINKITHVNK